ncbi:YegP family protein [Arenibacter sp. BSSL-BM3]|uniref:YegP family protein n=1 Tax=Arenibacter arenosicollis TaxID=2762274 RepID=A0ABR7QS14_9FLAO|nr:YegP family protein [Arenibacter arenosicollis]MBC8769975.1 YegP family protein [Arenibacter arenosicollis]
MLEIKKESDTTYTFSLQSESGQALLTSVPFNSRAEIDDTIAKLKILVGQSSVFERKTDYNGKFLFIMKNTEGKIIGKSMLYSSEAGMENGIKNLKTSISLLPDAIGL